MPFSVLRTPLHAFWLAVSLLPGLVPSASAQRPAAEVVVFGSSHIRYTSATEVPPAIPPIRQRLIAWKPDQVVIEWLHPSILPESTFNYPRLGDPATLRRLWGVAKAPTASTVDSLRVTVRAARGPVAAALRVELGRLLYLRGEEANAAYQWYLARRLGADLGGAGRLVTALLDGHEGVEFGFAAAAAAGLEEITPFDYQGPEAGSDVWGEMLEAIGDSAVVQVDRIRPGAATWSATRARFDSLRGAWENSRDSTWLRRYGGLPFVRQYVAVLDGFAQAQASFPAERDGLTQMRWWQSAEYNRLERRVQLEQMASITFGGFGPRRVAGLMARNRRMVGFLDADARRLGSGRILVVVGAGHKFALEEILKTEGYRIRPSAEFVP